MNRGCLRTETVSGASPFSVLIKWGSHLLCMTAVQSATIGHQERSFQYGACSVNSLEPPYCLVQT